MFDQNKKLVKAIEDLTESVRELNATLSNQPQPEPLDVAGQMESVMKLAFAPLLQGQGQKANSHSESRVQPSTVKGIRACR